MHQLKVSFLVLLLLIVTMSLSGCFRNFLKFDNQKTIEAFNAIGDAARGAAAAFSTVQRSRSVDGYPDMLCAGEPTRARLCAVQSAGILNWVLLGEGNKKIPIGSIAEGERVADFEIDRNWNYVAIVTASEGHAFLAMYDLQTWLREKQQPDPSYAINPYPGSLHMYGWDDNKLLSGLGYGPKGLGFSSSGPVLDSDDRTSSMWPLDDMRNYHLYPSLDTLKLDEVE